MKKAFTIIIFIFFRSLSSAQNITGDWYGILNIQNEKLHVAFHIHRSDNIYITTMDSPDQGAKGIATDKTTITSNQVIIEAAKFGLKYSGVYLPDSNKIKGEFMQGASSFPLILTADKISLIRPQDPTNFPYKREEITFTNPKAGNRLAGTLTTPTGKFSKIVVLIAGSGPENRNEEVFDHRPFLVWSDWLTRNGIAVLRYDKRGIDESTGNYLAATTADFADDAEAAISYIQSRSDFKGISIGLMGHSEGSLIAPIVASRNKAVKFVVLLAGPGVPSMQLMLKQDADVSRSMGATDQAIQQQASLNEKLFRLLARSTNLTTGQLKQQVDTLLYKDLQARNMSTSNLHSELYATLLTPWFRQFITLNPDHYLSEIKCPVLALNGTLDLQVNYEMNLAGIKAELDKAGNKNYEIVALTGLNHLFQKATTGSIAEYQQLSETVNPVALQTVSAWINHL